MKCHPFLLATVLWTRIPAALLSAQDGTVPQVNPTSGLLPDLTANADGTAETTDKLTSQNLIITRSEDRTEVRGFSATKGTWENLTLPQSDVFEWAADGNIAIVQAADTLAAFSAETGHWDVLNLSKDSKAVPTSLGSLVTIEDGGHFYTFSSKTSSWTSPTDTCLAFGEMRLPPMGLSSETMAAFQTGSDSQPRYQKSTDTSRRRCNTQRQQEIVP